MTQNTPFATNTTQNNLYYGKYCKGRKNDNNRAWRTWSWVSSRLERLKLQLIVESSLVCVLCLSLVVFGLPVATSLDTYWETGLVCQDSSWSPVTVNSEHLPGISQLLHHFVWHNYFIRSHWNQSRFERAEMCDWVKRWNVSNRRHLLRTFVKTNFWLISSKMKNFLIERG